MRFNTLFPQLVFSCPGIVLERLCYVFDNLLIGSVKTDKKTKLHIRIQMDFKKQKLG